MQCEGSATEIADCQRRPDQPTDWNQCWNKPVSFRPCYVLVCLRVLMMPSGISIIFLKRHFRQKPSKPSSMGYLRKFQSIRWSLPLYTFRVQKCWICFNTFDNRTELHRHLSGKTHTRLAVICPWCLGKQKIFTRINDLSSMCGPVIKVCLTLYLRHSSQWRRGFTWRSIPTTEGGL